MVAKGVRIVQQSEAMVIERFGKYRDHAHCRLQRHHPRVRQAARDHLPLFTRELPDGNKYVQFVKKERIDLRETVYDFPRRT
jgi:regulator of protease activity HflC (stomatin/prohibitin superfamily)